ncbi:transporter substrate-binding domain-containing protein [Celerinatantimonas yamalensis]|uniref:Transporter substrate-binding domain-containing protein n=1 Tax=Celerinatantimonas yamalensis TaxID=559956 RepID=A0ABW9G958_9GAMM
MNIVKCLIVALGVAAVPSVWAGTTAIKFGVEPQYPPMESKTSDGKLVGFDIDLGNAICQQAKLKCSWVESSFDTLIPALKAKKFDVINSSMDITPQRAKAIAFTHAIYQLPSQLIAHNGSGLKPTAEALKGKNIGVLQGSTQESYAMKHWQPNGVNIVPYKDQNQVYYDMVSGRLDGTLVNSTSGQAGFLDKAQGKGYSFMGKAVYDPEIFGPGIGFGLRKSDSALVTRINKAINVLKAQGLVHQLSKKYFKNVDVSLPEQN